MAQKQLDLGVLSPRATLVDISASTEAQCIAMVPKLLFLGKKGPRPPPLKGQDSKNFWKSIVWRVFWKELGPIYLDLFRPNWQYWMNQSI